MDKLVESIGAGIKRTIDTLIGTDSNTKDDAHESEDTNAHSTHGTSPTSPDSQPQTKRARTQYNAHPEERPRARRPHTQSSPYQDRVRPPLGRSERQPKVQQPSFSQRKSSSSIDFESNQRARNQGKKPSTDEIRLVPGTYPQTQDSIPLSVPPDEWGNMNNTRRKPGRSVYKPTNSLNRSGVGSIPLPTMNTRGVNVEEPSVKRQKTSHDHVEEHFWNRSVQEQLPATLPRQSSVISLNSQSQDNLSHSQKHNGFRQIEHEDVHRVLNAHKKKGRKPKATSTQASSPFPYGTNNDPVSVEDDDDDEVQFVNEQPAPPQSARELATQQRPLHNAAQNQGRFNGPQQTIEVESAWHRNRRAEEERKRVLKMDRVEITVPPRNSSVATPKKRSLSPRMGESFVRDQGEPQESPATRQAQPRMRDKMQSKSNTSRVLKPRSSVEESSEDELSREQTGSQSARRSMRTQRSPSPNHIVASKFFTGSRPKAQPSEGTAIRLRSLRMLAGEWEGETLYLISPVRHKVILFQNNGEFLHLRNSRIQLTAAHATKVFCSNQDSDAIILSGATDQQSKGRIWFDFFTRETRDCFLDLVQNMNANLKVTLLDDDKFNTVINSSEHCFMPKTTLSDPEHQAMEYRQGTTSKPMTERERNIAIQKGALLSESDNQPPTRRKTQMRSDFTNRPATNPALDYSLPPPTPRTERGTVTRSSQRLQTKVDGKVAQPSEPELVRWTHVNGIPEWDGPLTYPFTGSNRTTVEAEDIARLDDGELLNDNIISFCLRDMEESNPELGDKAHIFNSFFYERLTTLGSGKKGFNYEAVSRWTRTKDLFSLPFVVVPINTQYHWFLVIICNLDQLYRKISLDGLKDDREEVTTAEPSSTAQETTQSQSTLQNDLEIPESPQESKDSDLSQIVKRISLHATQDQEDEALAESKPKTTPRKGKRQGPAPQKMDPTTPALLLLDSLGGTHPQEIKNLKQYAVHEGREKRALEFEYTELKGMTARGLPQQTNFCDCGVYLIGYMEAFLRDPHEFARKVMSRELDHNNDFVDFDPSKKRAEIRERLLDLHRQQTMNKKQKKKAAHLAKMEAKRSRETKSAAGTPVQMSSPMKPSAAHENSRMVQSSPMKPPPKQMQRSSPPVPFSSRKVPTSDRDADDDMLFNQGYENGHYQGTSTAPSSRDSQSHTQHGSTERSHDRPATIAYEVSFTDELQKAIQEGQTERDDE